jgi:hypothetical protein
MPGLLEMDRARPISFCVLVMAALLACGACSSPTTSSKLAIQNVRVVLGLNSVGSDATGLQWGVGWSVFLDAGTPLDDAPLSGGMFVRGLAGPVSVTEVSSTIAAPDDHVLATFVTSAPQIAVQNSGTTQVTGDRGIVVNQGGCTRLLRPRQHRTRSFPCGSLTRTTRHTRCGSRMRSCRSIQCRHPAPEVNQLVIRSVSVHPASNHAASIRSSAPASRSSTRTRSLTTFDRTLIQPMRVVPH